MAYSRCLFRNEWPDPLLRYLSNWMALVLEGNAQYQASFQGRLEEVNLCPPWLWVLKRFFRSFVLPT